MTRAEFIERLKKLIEEAENDERTAESVQNVPNDDLISQKAAIDKFIDGLEEIFADLRERHGDDSVCGLCEYDGAYLGQSGDWCNECPGFEKDDCFKLSGKIRKKWADEIIKAVLAAQPEIIRCKDCIYQVESWIGMKYCEVNGDHIGVDYDYCSNARRKENG